MPREDPKKHRTVERAPTHHSHGHLAPKAMTAGPPWWMGFWGVGFFNPRMERGLYATILRKTVFLLVESSVFLVDRLRTQEAISKTWWCTHITIPHIWIFVWVSKRKQTTLFGGVPFASLTERFPNRRLFTSDGRVWWTRQVSRKLRALRRK